jgi:hypothetical protein
MTTLTLLVDLRRRGLILAPEGTGIRVAPRSSLTPELRETVRTHKADLLAALSIETRVLEMPLSQFEREGCPIEIRIPSFPETLWFVPGDRERDILVTRGISHGRIWTALELMELWKAPSLTQKHAQSLARIKAQFDADVVSVERLIEEGEPSRGDE